MIKRAAPRHCTSIPLPTRRYSRSNEAKQVFSISRKTADLSQLLRRAASLAGIPVFASKPRGGRKNLRRPRLNQCERITVKSAVLVSHHFCACRPFSRQLLHNFIVLPYNVIRLHYGSELCPT